MIVSGNFRTKLVPYSPRRPSGLCPRTSPLYYLHSWYYKINSLPLWHGPSFYWQCAGLRPGTPISPTRTCWLYSSTIPWLAPL